jgi:hypothetical protein
MRTLFGWGIKLPVPKGLWQCVMLHGYFIRDKALNCDLFELGVKPLRLMAGTRSPDCFVYCAQWMAAATAALMARSWEDWVVVMVARRSSL